MDRQTGHATGGCLAGIDDDLGCFRHYLAVFPVYPIVAYPHFGISQWAKKDIESGWSGHLYPVSSRLPKETPQFARQALAPALMLRLGPLALSCGHL